MLLELKRIALWTAVLFLPIAFIGFALVVPDGNLGIAALVPVGLFIVLPWKYLSGIGIWSGPFGILAYIAQYFWCFLLVALVRWLVRKASNIKSRPNAAKTAP